MSPRIVRAAQLEKARALIDAAPAADHTLAKLAQAAGLSRDRFVRAFSHHFGVPPHSYILKMRLELVGQLILEGRDLAIIAAQCGFADQSHMTRAFRQHYGMPPGRWALTQKQTAQD